MSNQLQEKQHCSILSLPRLTIVPNRSQRIIFSIPQCRDRFYGWSDVPRLQTEDCDLIEERMELYPAMLPKSPRAPEEHESLELTSKSQARRQKHPKQSNLRFPKPS